MNLSNLISEVSDFVSKLYGRPNVFSLSSEQSKKCAGRFGMTSASGSLIFNSYIKTASSAHTVYVGRELSDFATQKKKDIAASLEKTLNALFAYLQKTPMACTDGRLGDNSSFTPSCRLFVSCCRPESVHLNYMFSIMSFAPEKEPDMTVICVPEWPEKERQVLVFSEIGVTFVLGSDYYGEIKNAFLRMAIILAKGKGLAGLHAASKTVTAADSAGGLKNIGIVIFGIASTGKTTLACHDYGLKGEEEKTHLLQDDLVFWDKDGGIIGSENGLYIRTDGLSAYSQPILWQAANSPEAVLENVFADYRGNICFEDKTITSNGHGVIPRKAMPEWECINMPPPDKLDRTIFFFVTKNFTVVPVLSKLNPEQAAIAYMLSEPFDAVGSEIGKLDGRGGVPAVAVGTGNSAEDINAFYRRLLDNPSIECYMLNNGGVGELVDTGLDGGRRIRRKVTRISISDISAAIRGVLRNNVVWTEDKNWMCEVPSYIEGLDLSVYDLYAHYDQSRIDMLISAVRNERRAFASKYEALNKKITDSIEY